ncbi:MAG: type IV secretion system DNA-binding domain-containing protein [Candidatus Eisenbacteria bacterium]|nr:type IV secretion system DNA-binding domain-containing protein [Candidatus Eisenbacteria bacterium]
MGSMWVAGCQPASLLDLWLPRLAFTHVRFGLLSKPVLTCPDPEAAALCSTALFRSHQNRAILARAVPLSSLDHVNEDSLQINWPPRVRARLVIVARVLGAAISAAAIAAISFIVCLRLGRPEWLATLLATIVGGLALRAAWLVLVAPVPIHLRGARLFSRKEAAERAEADWQEVDPERSEPRAMGLSFGGLRIHPSRATHNFLFVGQVGSGKSTLITLLMQDALARVGQGEDTRAVVYDAGGEAYEQLRNIPSQCRQCGTRYPLGRWAACEVCGEPVTRVHNLNPFDQRAVPWDMAKDIKGPDVSYSVAELLVPRRDERNPFFTNSVRRLLSGVLDALYLTTGEAWRFGDVCRILRDELVLERVLAQRPETRSILANIAREGTRQDVLSSVATEMRPFEIVASLWELSPEPAISLRQWMFDVEGSILVLPRQQDRRELSDLLNRVLFRRLNQLLQTRSPGTSGRTWFFLDELPQAGLDDAVELAANARKFGGAIVMGFQDIGQLRERYGKNAETLVGMAAFKGLLRIDSPETRRWAAEVLGHEEIRRRREHYGPTGQFSEQVGPENRPVVHPDEFGNLPISDFRRGIFGWFSSPVTGSFGHADRTSAQLPAYTGAELCARLLPRDPRTPNRVLYGDTDAEIRRRFLRTEWTRADVERLHGLDLGQDQFGRRRVEQTLAREVGSARTTPELPDLEPEQQQPEIED